MEKQKTAVEWLVSRLKNLDAIDNKDVQQAKQMEKEQIIEAYKADCETLGNDDTFNNEAEQYYESKYCKDENKAENND